MTSILLLAAMQSGPRVIEVPDQSADRIVIQAIVRVPFAMGEREAAAWMSLNRLLLVGSQDYTTAGLIEAAGGTGELPQIEALPGLLRIQVAVPPTGLEEGARIIESLLKTPSLRQKSADWLLAQEASAKPTGWAKTLEPERGVLRGAYRDRPLPAYTLSELVSQAFQPKNMTLVVSGKFAGGLPSAEFANRLTGFAAPPRRGVTRLDPTPAPSPRRSDGFASFEIRGLPVGPKSPSLPAAVLAVSALGTGKEATVFRVLRQGKQLSYQQAALMWPSPDGWTPRILLLQKASSGSGELPGVITTAIKEDIGAWDEETLARAKAMTKTAFNVGLEDGPLWLGASGSSGPTAASRSALQGLFAAMGYEDSALTTLPAKIEEVALADLKAAATEIVEKGSSYYISGS